MTPPLVSIVIPYYEQPDYLLDAVRSCESQTYREIEILVIDDGSRSGTADEILGWRESDLVRIVRHDTNRGAAAARNTGIREARGDLFVPLDADDHLAPDFLERTLAGLPSGGRHGGAYTDVQVFGDAEFVWVFDCSLPAHLTWGGPNTALFRREVWQSVGGYKEQFRFGEDFDFWVSALAKGWTFSRVEEPLYFYRRHEGGKSARKDWTEVMRNLLREHGEVCARHIDSLLADQAAHLREKALICLSLKADLERLRELKRDYQAKLLRLRRSSGELSA